MSSILFIFGGGMLIMENRFKEARVKHNQHGQQSVKDVAKITGLTGSLIDDLESSLGKPRDVGYSKVKKLAEHYGVSSDYLLGLSDTPSVKEDIQVVCKTTGLTEKAVEAIKESRGWGTDVLNCFLEDSKFFNLLSEVRRLATAKYRLKVAETDLTETSDAGYKERVMRFTEKRIIQEYWTVEKFKELQNRTVDTIISQKL